MRLLTLIFIFCIYLSNINAQPKRNDSDKDFFANVVVILKDSISSGAYDSLDFSVPRTLMHNERHQPSVVTFGFKNGAYKDSCVIVGIKEGVFTGNWLSSKKNKENTGRIFTTSFDGRTKGAIWFKNGKNLRATRTENGIERVLFDYSKEQ